MQWTGCGTTSLDDLRQHGGQLLHQLWILRLQIGCLLEIFLLTRRIGFLKTENLTSSLRCRHQQQRKNQQKSANWQQDDADAWIVGIERCPSQKEATGHQQTSGQQAAGGKKRRSSSGRTSSAGRKKLNTGFLTGQTTGQN